MQAEEFIKTIGAEFYTGVPDSQLQAFCNCLMKRYGIDPKHHVVAANEGNCAALAAGYQMATGKVPVVYLQNSGEGNIINPAVSLLNRRVYAIPVIFVIGWRGEPGIHDEPQHAYQGEITLKLLEDMEISAFVVDADTSIEELARTMEQFERFLEEGRNVAFVICKGALSYSEEIVYKNSYALNREEAISHIAACSGEDMIVSTTGKASRELYEIREANGQEHKYDFLTVGSMGHASSIALGIAVQKPGRKVWCIDGDGALLMHMGAMAVIGACRPENFIHIVLNNTAHETVGGMPTVAGNIDLVAIAKACGYSFATWVETLEDLDLELEAAREQKGPSFLEVKCALGSRKNLGRPRTTPLENKMDFMDWLRRM